MILLATVLRILPSIWITINYFGYGVDWDDAEQESDRTQFINLKTLTAKTLDGGTFTQEDIAAKNVTIINFRLLLREQEL